MPVDFPSDPNALKEADDFGSYRPLSLEDAGHVHNLEQELFDSPWSLEQISDEFVCPQGFSRGYVIASGQVTAYALFRYLDAEAELLKIGVLPARHRQGIAGKLLGRSLGELQTLGVSKVRLEVRESNTAARALYESQLCNSCTFKAVGRRHRYYSSLCDETSGGLDDAILYELKLCSVSIPEQ